MPRDGVVLVVDDDESVRDLVVVSLLLEGYPVREASNGREALRIIDESEPRLVLLDMQLPDIDGWGVARELKSRGRDASILVMTGRSKCRGSGKRNWGRRFLGEAVQS